MEIYAAKLPLCRGFIKPLKPIITRSSINVGYGPGQLRPNGARDIRAEERQLAIRVLRINGLSGQLTG
jgi:hypothetical protein